jgi:hypothetical protein
MVSSGMLHRVALVRTDYCHLDEGGATFLQNDGSYKCNTA